MTFFLRRKVKYRNKKFPENGLGKPNLGICLVCHFHSDLQLGSLYRYPSVFRVGIFRAGRERDQMIPPHICSSPDTRPPCRPYQRCQWKLECFGISVPIPFIPGSRKGESNFPTALLPEIPEILKMSIKIPTSSVFSLTPWILWMEMALCENPKIFVNSGNGNEIDGDRNFQDLDISGPYSHDSM